MSLRKALLLSISLLVGLASSNLEAGTAIASLNDRYQSESLALVKEGASSEKRRQFHEAWLSRFLAAIEQNVDDPMRVVALERATELANTTLRYKLSLELLDKRLALARGTSARLNLVYQKGEVCQTAFAGTRDVSYARQAVKYFAQLDQEIEQHFPESDLHGAQRVIGLSHMARLTGDALKDHGRAAQLYTRARQVLERLGPREVQRLGGYRELTASGAAVEYALAGELKSARETLSDLAALQDLKRPLGLHILLVLRAARTCDVELSRFVESWYRNAGGRSEFAPQVALVIGRRLMMSPEPALRAEAVQWFETLLADHREVLRRDPVKKGIVVEALRALATTCDSLSRSGDAAAARKELQDLTGAPGVQSVKPLEPEEAERIEWLGAASSEDPAAPEPMVTVVQAPNGVPRTMGLFELQAIKQPWAAALAGVVRDAVHRVPAQYRDIFVVSLLTPPRQPDATYASMALRVWDERLWRANLAYLKKRLEVEADRLIAVPPVSREEANRVQLQINELLAILQVHASDAGWDPAVTVAMTDDIKRQAAAATSPTHFGVVLRPLPDAALGKLKRELPDKLPRERPQRLLTETGFDASALKTQEAVRDLVLRPFSDPPAPVSANSKWAQDERALSRLAGEYTRIETKLLATPAASAP